MLAADMIVVAEGAAGDPAGASTRPRDSRRILGKPDDKAGAYAVQGLGSLFVLEIDGNYSNVVGLPLPTVRQLLEGAGSDLEAFRRTRLP